MQRTPIFVFLLSSMALAVAACATVESAERAAAEVLIPLDQENALGEQIHRKLEQEGLRYVQDPFVVQKVQEIATPILQQAKRKAPKMAFHVHVVDNPGSVNAFATPGGHIYVESGLLQAVDSEAELAGVIAHEAGHVTERHAARNMVQAFGLQTVAALALGQDPSQLEKIAASVVAQGTLLANSRSQEIEADETGVVFATRAGYDPQGLIGFFRKLQQMTGRTPRALTWLSTHPSSEDRIANLQGYIREHHLSASGGHQSLAELHQRLQQSPQQGIGGGGQPPRP